MSREKSKDRDTERQGSRRKPPVKELSKRSQKIRLNRYRLMDDPDEESDW